MAIRMNERRIMNVDRAVSVCANSSVSENTFCGTVFTVPFFAFSRFYSFFYYYYYFMKNKTAKCRKCFG